MEEMVNKREKLIPNTFLRDIALALEIQAASVHGFGNAIASKWLPNFLWRYCTMFALCFCTKDRHGCYKVSIHGIETLARFLHDVDEIFGVCSTLKITLLGIPMNIGLLFLQDGGGACMQFSQSRQNRFRMYHVTAALIGIYAKAFD